jgi:ATP-dependent Clp endopeptidase proteolytic subunit ClpP
MIRRTLINGEENTPSTDLVKSIDDKNVVIYVNAFTEDSAKNFYNEFSKAVKARQQVIPIVIDSYGGYVDSLISMMDIIESSSVPVATIATGKAMSCGSILLSCGKDGMRYIAPSARVMIHHVSRATWGKVPDMKVDVEESERIQELIFSKMAKNCGKQPKYFLDQLKERGNIDWYLTPEECVKHNVVNHIKLPEFRTKVTIETILV